MMLYEGDSRRCRRCKRKRMDDEPPEVQQYKTCAKCRIIERTKKKLRKPLAEETMRYGMRQFQEQNQGANFIHDDIFTNEQLMEELAAREADIINPLKQLYNTQFTVYKQPNAGGPYAGSAGPAQPTQNYNYTYGNNSPYPAGAPQTSAGLPAFLSPQVAQQMPLAGPTSSATAAAIAAAAIKGNDASLGSSQSLNRSQNHYRQYQQRHHGDRSRLNAPTACELCSTSLDSDDNMSSMYYLCRPCYTDPYSRPNVFSDFNDFLLSVVGHKDAESVTFVSELAAYLVESLNTNRVINSEEQFRRFLLESFTLIYLEPLKALLDPLKFVVYSQNVAEVNNTAPVLSKVSLQLHYTLTPPLRVSYVENPAGGRTTFEMTFVTETNLIIIKKTTKKAPSEYTTAFLKSLDEKMRAKGFTFDDDASKIFAALELSISLEQFVRDFASLKHKVSALRADEADATSEANGASYAVNGEKSAELAKDAQAGISLSSPEGAQQNVAPASGNGIDESEGDESSEGEDDEEDESSEDDTDEPQDLDPAFAP